MDRAADRPPILGGDRDPATLAALNHPGIDATQETIAKRREGT